VALSSEVCYPDVVESRCYIRVELAVSTPLAFQDGLEERKRIQGVAFLQEQ
jgi:hypothetical protein